MSFVHLLGAWPVGGHMEVQDMALPSWDFQLRYRQKHASKPLTHNAQEKCKLHSIGHECQRSGDKMTGSHSCLSGWGQNRDQLIIIAVGGEKKKKRP